MNNIYKDKYNEINIEEHWTKKYSYIRFKDNLPPILSSENDSPIDKWIHSYLKEILKNYKLGEDKYKQEMKHTWDIDIN